MTLHERVTARLDEIEEAAVHCTARGGVSLTPAAVGVAFQRPVWTVEQYLPSLRRRVERHRAQSCWPSGCCQLCASCTEEYGDMARPYPCDELRDLCAEIGIDPEETT